MHRRKRKEDNEPELRGGFYYSGLCESMRESLVEYARLSLKGAVRDGHEALKEHDTAKLARREERLVELQNAAVDHYARSMELFDAWVAQRATSRAAVESAMRGHSEAAQLEFLRK